LTKNNNVWAALTCPMTNRPGDPAGYRPKPSAREVMPPELVAQAHSAAPMDRMGLSPRQMQVLDLLVQGATPTQIAPMLGIGLSAVSKYTTGIKKRLKVQTLAQAVLAWHRHYRVMHPDPQLGNKDQTLINNLRRAIDAQHALDTQPANKKEAA
jgi:DNA-binding CsgD family transcriptional regulator